MKKFAKAYLLLKTTTANAIAAGIKESARPVSAGSVDPHNSLPVVGCLGRLEFGNPELPHFIARP